MAAAVIPITRRLPLLGERPKTRGECADGPRPCPWKTCVHHMSADPAFSCVLDVADEGGVGLDTVGRAIGYTRERARQIEEIALRKVARRGVLDEWDDGHGDHKRRTSSRVIDSIERTPRAERERRRQDDDGDVARISFFAAYDVDRDGIEAVERADEAVSAAVWNMFAKDSNGRGFDARSRASKAGTKQVRGWRANYGIKGTNMALREAIETAHAGLVAKLGRPPTIRELFGATDASVTKSAANVAMACKRYSIEVTRVRGPGAVKVEKPATEKPARRPRASKVTEAAPASGMTAIDVLRAELRRTERAVEALNAALAVLEGR